MLRFFFLQTVPSITAGPLHLSCLVGGSAVSHPHYFPAEIIGIGISQVEQDTEGSSGSIPFSSQHDLSLNAVSDSVIHELWQPLGHAHSLGIMFSAP